MWRGGLAAGVVPKRRRARGALGGECGSYGDVHYAIASASGGGERPGEVLRVVLRPADGASRTATTSAW